jgi:alkylated DNA repair protein (DNA oxidative demethylase)
MAEGAVLLRGFVGAYEAELVTALRDIVAAAPFRRMFTPGGHQMSVAMTNCGNAGWVTDRTGYRYSPDDPETGKPWPAMPPLFRELADRAAEHAGFAGFAPDVCLINRYEPGARMSLHRTRTSSTSAHRSFRCRWDCPRFSCSADRSAATSRAGFVSSMAT